jgi:hypothetical protein
MCDDVLVRQVLVKPFICHYLLRCVHAHKTAELVGEYWLPALKQTDLVDHMV